MKKTKKMMAGVVASFMTASVIAGCSSKEEVQVTEDNRPPEPTDVSCNDWDWDDETGTYYCDDRQSSNFGMYYFMSQMFGSKSMLKANSGFKQYHSTYKSSSSSSKSSSSSVKSKSGIGSGSKGSFGG